VGRGLGDWDVGLGTRDSGLGTRGRGTWDVVSGDVGTWNARTSGLGDARDSRTWDVGT